MENPIELRIYYADNALIYLPLILAEKQGIFKNIEGVKITLEPVGNSDNTVKQPDQDKHSDQELKSNECDENNKGDEGVIIKMLKTNIRDSNENTSDTEIISMRVIQKVVY
ncbi:MAG: hypothetical protein ORN85_08180 [Sediminibacterium sp.]|nr:hypothetical protein [Sediminibacterium sp.]